MGRHKLNIHLKDPLPLFEYVVSINEEVFTQKASKWMVVEGRLVFYDSFEKPIAVFNHWDYCFKFEKSDL